jgi:hypothetical protein
MRNSENFGVRITENRASDRKMWFSKLWRVKCFFQKVIGDICGIFESQEALVQKNKGSCEDWGFFGDF